MTRHRSRGAAVVGYDRFAMAVLRVLLVVAALGAHAHTFMLPGRSDEVALELEPQLTGGFRLSLQTDDEQLFLGHIGRTVISPYTIENLEEGVEIHINGVNLTINTVYEEANDARGIMIKWNAEPERRLEDCFDFGTNYWYGGPMQVYQPYPIETSSQIYAPYVTKEDTNGAIIERYWVNSAGHYIYVNPEVPLFVDYNNLLSGHVCFGAQVTEPYSATRNHTELSYNIWLLPDVKQAHMHAVANYLGKPSGLPDFRMVQHPIWSTWAQYSRDIDETKSLEFANQIISYGFNNSQFEIDDLWEVCYGSLTVDSGKFPNFANLIQQIKALGFRVTIWVHPFINMNCDPWYTEALTNGYLVLNENGSPNTSWWNNNGSVPGYVDFTNPDAAEWWYQRVRSLLDTYDIDSLKFDAGESSHSPQIPVQHGDIDLHPHHIVDSFVRTCARFGNMIEIRTGFRTQELPVFIRMVDRDSIWGLNNGLSTIITTTLQMNLNGYTYVLPDMIGGNGFNLEHEQAENPTKELFIRWVQANTFLPTMQYSFVPWNFDNETVEICKKYTELHAAYADEIYAAMNASVNHGHPVNAPLWWLDPTDAQALVIWDEYLLGENILVAPILNENATSRDIYLPKGVWLEEGDPERVHEGPTTIKNYPAPIDVLPYFIRQSGDNEASAATSNVASILVLTGVYLANIIFGY